MLKSCCHKVSHHFSLPYEHTAFTESISPFPFYVSPPFSIGDFLPARSPTNLWSLQLTVYLLPRYQYVYFFDHSGLPVGSAVRFSPGSMTSNTPLLPLSSITGMTNITSLHEHDLFP
jgi:hypothetical protein